VPVHTAVVIGSKVRRVGGAGGGPTVCVRVVSASRVLISYRCSRPRDSISLPVQTACGILGLQGVGNAGGCPGCPAGFTSAGVYPEAAAIQSRPGRPFQHRSSTACVSCRGISVLGPDAYPLFRVLDHYHFDQYSNGGQGFEFIHPAPKQNHLAASPYRR